MVCVKVDSRDIHYDPSPNIFIPNYTVANHFTFFHNGYILRYNSGGNAVSLVYANLLYTYFTDYLYRYRCYGLLFIQIVISLIFR